MGQVSISLVKRTPSLITLTPLSGIRMEPSYKLILVCFQVCFDNMLIYIMFWLCNSQPLTSFIYHYLYISLKRWSCGHQVGQVGFHRVTPVSSHRKTTQTQSLVPTSMINISYMYLFWNRCKIIKVEFEKKGYFHECIWN